MSTYLGALLRYGCALASHKLPLLLLLLLLVSFESILTSSSLMKAISVSCSSSMSANSLSYNQFRVNQWVAADGSRSSLSLFLLLNNIQAVVNWKSALCSNSRGPFSLLIIAVGLDNYLCVVLRSLCSLATYCLSVLQLINAMINAFYQRPFEQIIWKRKSNMGACLRWKIHLLSCHT